MTYVSTSENFLEVNLSAWLSRWNKFRMSFYRHGRIFSIYIKLLWSIYFYKLSDYRSSIFYIIIPAISKSDHRILQYPYYLSRPISYHQTQWMNLYYSTLSCSKIGWNSSAFRSIHNSNYHPQIYKSFPLTSESACACSNWMAHQIKFIPITVSLGSYTQLLSEWLSSAYFCIW